MMGKKNKWEQKKGMKIAVEAENSGVMSQRQAACSPGKCCKVERSSGQTLFH